MHRVAVWIYEGLAPFELGVVLEVFGMPRPELALDYDVVVCAEEPTRLRTFGGLSLSTDHGLDTLATADTVVIPGCPDVDGEPPPAVVAGVRDAAARGARVASVCSGAFVLAAAGLLDGRRATTHWRYSERLARRYPRVTVAPDVLYVDEGGVLTSAGTAAGIDLCLHLVRRDHGVAAANAVARRMVVAPHREGGQAQYVEQPVPDGSGDDGPLRALLAALEADPTRQVVIGDLAREAHMSERTFMRRFRQVTGTSPLRWLLAQRLARARTLLETTDEPVERIADLAGFGSAEAFRLHFRRAVSTSPSAYRRSFRRPAVAIREP